MEIEFVAEATGTPKYLVFDPDMTEPWVTDLLGMIQETRSFDVATVFLLTPRKHIEEVKVESTDGDPDYLNWKVTLVEGGEEVEYLELSDEVVDEVAYRLSHVHGFQSV